MPAPKKKTARFAPLQDILFGVSFLTRIPCHTLLDGERIDLARAIWTFPVVGAAIGLLCGGLYFAASSIGLAPWLAACLAMTGALLLTGALHEDGFADVADGFGGGATLERKLAIMRDSQVGTYGAAALVLSLTIRIGAIAALAEPLVVVFAWLTAGAVSRGVLIVAQRVLPPARSDGIAGTTGGIGMASATGGIVLSVTLPLAMSVAAFTDWPLALGQAAVALLVAAALGAVMALVAWRQIRGHTGDVLGAIQQVAEIGVWLSFAAMLV